MTGSGVKYMAATLACILCLATGPALAAGIVIVNLDGAGEGLNDPEARSAVGGNTGTTLGEQRLNVLQAAADQWAAILGLQIEIRVGAEFNELDCETNSAVLGSAGTNFVFRDFPGALRANTWYPAALADALRGSDSVASGDQHIGSQYNARLDDGDANCLGGNAWYYGLDGSPDPGTVPLYPVVLHEIAHGLGFSTFVNSETGERFNNFDDIYMTFLRDNAAGLDWPDMTDGQRADSAINDPSLVWTGSEVDSESAFVTAPSAFDGGRLRMHAPDPLEPGSSVSHWTSDASPDLLMEPSLGGIFDQVDLTPALFRDLGWPIETDIIFFDSFE